MKKLVVPIDRAGRIVVPKAVREELAIEPGDLLKLSVHGSSVVLMPSKQKTGFIRKRKALVFTASGGATLTQDETNAILEATRQERAEHILGMTSKP